MDIGIWVCVAILILIIGILLVKIYLLKKSIKEIRTGFAEKMDNRTNTLIQISSHDKDIRELATSLNEQLLILNQSRNKYEHGDLELKEAVTNISHDLRTPLTAIFGYLKLLESEDCSPDAKTYLMSIKNRTQALKSLTDELFQYTISISDNSEMIIEKVNLRSILEKSISEYYSVFKQNGIVPEISMPDDGSVFCMGNGYALSRVIDNIINNAVKYSDGDLKVVLKSNGEMLFSNHAPNMTEVQVARLFDRFYTVSNARKSTGLGLSISKILMAKMNGTITAGYHQGILTINVKTFQKHR